jgi:DNA-binding LacI/PurR family transcriptional regulator/DNA-binding transcriptional regulator YhcF (GntR family)
MDAIQSAFKTLKGELQSGVWNQGERLPSLAGLAHRCSVSRTTMWRALKLLKKESLLHTTKRGAITAGPAGVGPLKIVQHEYGWVRLKTRIRQDLITGNLSSGNLPPMNKLSLQYGVAIDTIRKSLMGLVREGVLAREGRSFRLKEHREISRRPSIVLISVKSTAHGTILFDGRLQRLAESLESECSRRGYQCRWEGLPQREPNGLLTFTSAIRKIDNPVGYIVSLWNPGSEMYWQRSLDALAFLVQRDLPVITVDQEGDLIFPESLLRCKNFRVLRIASERAGEAVAETLLHRGYHSLAFITTALGPSWARNRYAGLCSYYKQFGGSQSAVKLFTLDDSVGINALTMALLGINKSDLKKLYGERLLRNQIRELEAEIDLAMQEQLAKKTGTGSLANTVHDIARFLIDLVSKEHDRIGYDTLLSALQLIASNGAMDSYLASLFHRVLEASPGAVWVCSDDKTALIALSFLEKNKKRVPEDVSVIGFENWRESWEHQLSTFYFNMIGMVQQALLLIRDEKSLKSQPVISEVDGYVVERRTTRR